MGREDGAALVEFALVITLLMTFVMGILTYGIILGLHQSITHAASAATRAAVVVPEDEIPGRVATVVDDQLSWLGGRSTHVEVSSLEVGACEDGSGARCVAVTVSYPYEAQPILPSILGLPVPETVSSTAILELEAVS